MVGGFLGNFPGRMAYRGAWSVLPCDDVTFAADQNAAYVRVEQLFLLAASFVHGTISRPVLVVNVRVGKRSNVGTSTKLHAYLESEHRHD